jgi:signal transduction histidine kinase/CheY-like chemotaxis protein
MAARRSLRRLLTLGTASLAGAVGVVMLMVIIVFVTQIRTAEREADATALEQRVADEIVTTVYGQLTAAYRQLREPSSRNRQEFEHLDSIAYASLRQYLFQSMTTEARLEVEGIKERHQELEVAAYEAFDLIARGESRAAAARIANMETSATALMAAMDRFVALRERGRLELHTSQVTLLQRLLVGGGAVVLGLMILAILFARVIERRVVEPLDQLSAAAAQVGAGDLTARIPDQRDDELASVAYHFNDMTAHIQETRSEIERRNAELDAALRDLKATQQALIQQETLGAIGFMLAGLAHELNNPLAGILGSAEVLQDELRVHPDPAVRTLVPEIIDPLVNEAQRAGTLVRNLLQFSRKSSAETSAVNLKAAMDIAAGLRSYAYAQAGKHLCLDIRDDVWVSVDAQRLEHVAMNLMSNSLDAMRDGRGDTLIVRATEAGQGSIELTFQDNGPGFSKPERVFDAFYTTKAPGSGTGLGLTLVHRFVAEAGGSVEASNAPQGGARVAIRLPSAPPPQSSPSGARAQAAPSPKVESAPSLGGKKLMVLVVDDEPALRSIQRRFLTTLGVEVLSAANGAEAIATLERTPCDLVITDIRMPGEPDGIGLYDWIRRERPTLARRVLFVTGDIGEWQDDPVLGVGADRLLSKPFHRDEYLARVRALLDSNEDGRSDPVCSPAQSDVA